MVSGSASAWGGDYNIAVVVRLGGTLKVEALERAFGEVVRRHESLRTRLGIVDGVPVQVIEPAVRFRVCGRRFVRCCGEGSCGGGAAACR